MADWGVFDLQGNKVFDVDSLVDLKFSAKSKVSTFPVEQGSFASYNKAMEPFTLPIHMAVSGPRAEIFETTLAQELAQANLYNVVTDRNTYLNVTLESYDFSRSSESGLDLMVAQINFVQVREVTPAYTTVKLPKPKNPASASKQVGGKAQTQAPAKPASPSWKTLMSDAQAAAGGA